VLKATLELLATQEQIQLLLDRLVRLEQQVQTAQTAQMVLLAQWEIQVLRV
jgi:hypothetical protein